MILKPLEEINDIYFISERIKNINSNFRLFFNKNKDLYEVHNIKEKPSLVISYSQYPDGNLIEKLYKTNKDNMKSLFLEIDKNNNKIEKAREEHYLDKSKNALNAIFGYLDANPGKNLNQIQIKNILEKED